MPGKTKQSKKRRAAVAPTPRTMELGNQLWHIDHIRRMIFSDLDPTLGGNKRWTPRTASSTSNKNKAKGIPLFDYITWGRVGFGSAARVLWSTIYYEDYAKVKDAPDNAGDTGSPFGITKRLDVYRSSVKTLFLTGSFPRLHGVGGVEDLYKIFPNLFEIQWNHRVTEPLHFINYSFVTACGPATQHYHHSTLLEVTIDRHGDLSSLDTHSSTLPAAWNVHTMRQLHVGKISPTRRDRFDWKLRNDLDGDGLPLALQVVANTLALHPSHSIDTWVWILHTRNLMDFPPPLELNLGGSWLTLDQLHHIGVATGTELQSLIVGVKAAHPEHVLGFCWSLFPELKHLCLTIDCPASKATQRIQFYDSDSEGSGADSWEASDTASVSGVSDSTLSIDSSHLDLGLPALAICRLFYHVDVPPFFASETGPIEWIYSCLPSTLETASWLMDFPEAMDIEIKIITPQGCLGITCLGEERGHATSREYMMATLEELDEFRLSAQDGSDWWPSESDGE